MLHGGVVGGVQGAGMEVAGDRHGDMDVSDGINPICHGLLGPDRFSKIVENLNFAIWKKVFLTFIGPPRLNQER